MCNETIETATCMKYQVPFIDKIVVVHMHNEVL